MIINPWALTVAIANYAASRLPVDAVGWDRVTPLEAKYRRLYALREAGYKGWLDDDCWPITDAEAKIRQAKLVAELSRVSQPLAELLKEGRVS